MTNYYPTNSNNATTSNARANHANFDWTSFIATAMFEGGQAFLKTIGSATPNSDEAQLTQDANQVDRRFEQALDNAKLARTDPRPTPPVSSTKLVAQASHRHPSRESGRQAGPTGFYQPFQFDLRQEISTMILDLQLFWEQEDERRAAAAMQQAAAKRKEAEQAFGEAYPVVRGLNDAVLNGERERQVIFNDGQQAAQGWANRYEESVKARERQIEERENRIQQQERENREHQIAQRSLAKWDDRNSFANTVVSTGKNTIGCLLIWLLLTAGIWRRFISHFLITNLHGL